MEEKATLREKLFALHEELCKKARTLMRKKNDDYATPEDPLLNFRRHGPTGIIVRMDDKMIRCQRFVEKNGLMSVEDEGLEDTLADMINYAVLLLYMVREKNEQK